MPKNIVLCSDGTGNSALKGRGTNVFKVYEAIDLNGHKFDEGLQKQVAFYDDGVGTENFKPLKLLGGAFGWGLSRNVKELYTALAKCYEAGDHIYLFGFSRGAFTVRQLAGFIIGCGIIDKKKWKTDAELKRLVRKAFWKYRKRYHTWLGDLLKKYLPSPKKARHEFRQSYSFKDETHAPQGKVRLRFIGVWDTVAAVGLPFDELANFINRVIYCFKFPDRRLNYRVDKACHALAIDDERHSFLPEIWDEETETRDNRIEQVWFSGAHSNVGGGYPKQGMSLVALDWMMAKAEQQGLRFINSVRTWYREQQNINDKLYDSRSGLGSYYRIKVRDIGQMCSDNHISADLHVSSFDRITLATDGYAPVNLPPGLNIVATDNKPPGAGENPQSLKILTDRINKALTDNKQFLSKTRKWMSIRRYSHYAFLIMTIAIIWFAQGAGSPAVIESPLVNGFLNVVNFIAGDNIANFFKPILVKPEFGLTLLGLLVLFYLAGILLKNRIRRIFSFFWRKVLQ